MTESLHATVERMLESDTFEPDELVVVLVGKGHPEQDVRAAIRKVRGELDARTDSPAAKLAAQRGRTAGRLIRGGIFVMIVGLGFTAFFGGGILQLLLIMAGGSALVGAGFRTLRAR